MDLNKRLEIKVDHVENKSLTKKVLTKITRDTTLGAESSRLHDLFLKICLIQKSTHPALVKPEILLFAGDHKFHRETSAIFCQQSTHDLVIDLLNETAAVSPLLLANSLSLKIIDVGVDHSFEGTLIYWLNQGSRLFNRKIGYGARNILDLPALTSAEVDKSLKVGMDMAGRQEERGSNTLGLAAIGLGTELSAALLASALLEVKPKRFYSAVPTNDAKATEDVGEIFARALKMHPKTHDPFTLLAFFGGFEMAALTGAILHAAELRMVVLLDGFSALTALLIASRLAPEVIDYCIYCSAGDTEAEQLVLKELEIEPLSGLGLRIGQGSGIAFGFPTLKNTLTLLNGMPNDQSQADDFFSGHG